MFTRIPTPYKYVALLLIAGGLIGFGFMKGQDYANAKFEKARLALQEELFDLADDLSEVNAANLLLLKEKEELVHEHETQALQAPGSDNPGVSATGGLLRLDKRWGR